MNEQQVLQRPFDTETHKQTFVNYLEVIVDEKGEIMYAVPSHQEKLIQIACDKLKITREELYDKCPREYYANLITWLCNITGCISLWNQYREGEPNTKQQGAIAMLSEEGLYQGK